MFKTYLTYFLFLCSCLQLWSQEHSWEEPLFMDFHLAGGTRLDMDIDADGNTYVIGLFDEEVSVLDTTLYTTKDDGVLVAKFDINHNLLWSKVIAQAKEATPNLSRVISNVYIEVSDDSTPYSVIEYQDSILINNQLFTVDQTQTYYQDIAIVQMSSSSNVQSIYHIKGSCTSGFGGMKSLNEKLYLSVSNLRNSLDTDSTCTCIINSDTTLYTPTNTSLITSINQTSGIVDWIKTYQANNSTIVNEGLSITPSHLYITGTTFSSANLDFGEGNLSVPGIYSNYGYIAKFTLDGEYEWSNYFAVKGWDSDVIPMEIKINSKQDVILLGLATSQNTLNQVFFQNDQPLVGELNNDQNFFIVKYDSIGNITWKDISKGMGYDNGHSIDIDKHDNIYLAGTYSGNLIFGTDTLNSNTFSKDILVLSYDSLGNKRWIQSTGGIGTDVASKIRVDSLDHLHILGSITSDVTFGEHETSPPFGSSIFLGKMTLSEPLNNRDYTPKQFKTSIYPNPNSGICTIYTEEEDIQQMNIYNSLGQKTQAFEYTNFTNTISISQLKPGIYIVELISKSGKQVTQKLIVE